MRKIVVALAGLLSLSLLAGPAYGASKNVELLDNLPEAKNATAINFLEYGKDRGDDDDDDDGDDDRRGHASGGRRGSSDVMLVTGRFGLKSYSLRDPANPTFLDEITAEELRLPGDPPVDFTPDSAPRSTFWQNEDMDVDQDRKLALLSRDPRAYAGTTAGDPNPNPPAGSPTNIAGVYVIDARDPERLRLLSFQQLPTGHTTTCVNDCEWLWTGGPAASTTQQRPPLNWTFGRPIIVTDLSNPRRPRAFPMDPVDLFRRDGATAYSHDVQVDDAGTRGYWTEGRHFDPLEGRRRRATALDPIPYAGGGLPASVTGDTTGGFEHNAWRPVGRDAPRGDSRYRRGELLLATEEDFGPATEACANRGQFTIASLAGSFNGEAWRSTPASPFRLQTVGKWSPAGKEGSRPVGGPYNPLANFCSAHYFDVDGSTVTYAWYGEGTRFLDISNPANPTQFAYWRPEDGIVWASYMHDGYVYTADRTRGVDVLRLTGGATVARAASREVSAPPPSKRQLSFLDRASRQFTTDPGTAGICLIEVR
ncbi:MAG TPA: hypothetical protein VGW14_08735 [Thermoleophilaceae bacterium]|nr:hypothetical protein [Thermoleophilaceae bacterium]